MKTFLAVVLTMAMVMIVAGAAGATTAFMMYGDNFDIVREHLAIPAATRLTLTHADAQGPFYAGMLGGEAVRVRFFENSASELLIGFADPDLGSFRVDLAKVVSKYIDDTEENLENLFNTRDDSYVIIFFDDADALFGRNSRYGDLGMKAPLPPGVVLAGPVILGLLAWRSVRRRRAS